MRYGQQSDRSIPDVAYMDSYLLFFWAGRQFPPGVALASVALGSTPKGCSFASLCIAAIAAVCKTATFDTPVVRVHHGALGLMGVAACVTDGIARISPLEHVGDKRLPALIRWLMTEGEARPNGCIDVSRSLPLVVKPIPPCRTSFRLGR